MHEGFMCMCKCEGEKKKLCEQQLSLPLKLLVWILLAHAYTCTQHMCILFSCLACGCMQQPNKLGDDVSQRNEMAIKVNYCHNLQSKS